MTSNTLLAVDGNSLLHRSFHALLASGLTTRDGRPTWAIKGFLSLLLGAVERTQASAVVVGFDDHSHSVRKAAHPHYKAQRAPKPAELGQQIAMTIDLLRSAGIAVVVPAGLEADDVLASAGAFAPTVGWNTVIVTSDRDSFALIDDHTRVLRLINGGVDASPILTADHLVTMYGVHPSNYRDYAAMRGDTADNLTGIRGVGEKTAAKLLSVFGSTQAAFDDVDQGGARVAAALGKSFVAKLGDPSNRAEFARNVEIMTMHQDIPLGLELPGGHGTIPLPVDAVLAALDSLELASLRHFATRVLCGAPSSQARPLPAAPSPASPPLPWSDDDFRREPAGPRGAALMATSGAMRGSLAPRPSSWDDLL